MRLLPGRDIYLSNVVSWQLALVCNLAEWSRLQQPAILFLRVLLGPFEALDAAAKGFVKCTLVALADAAVEELSDL
jgi:hypothetical protein